MRLDTTDQKVRVEIYPLSRNFPIIYEKEFLYRPLFYSKSGIEREITRTYLN